MSFGTGLSGLNAASKNLDVIGHNIANANTTGMKAGRAEFAEMYAASLGAAGGSNGGIGVSVANVAQLFTQGNLKITGNQLDLAINGPGFFMVQKPAAGDVGETFYTRNGEFKLDKDGYIVTNQGYRLLGYETDEEGLQISQVAQPIRFPTSEGVAPRRTGGHPDSDRQGVFLNMNLDADAGVFAPGGNYSIVDGVLNYDSGSGPSPTQGQLTQEMKRYGTSIAVYNTKGQQEQLQIYFVKTEEGAGGIATWNVLTSADGLTYTNLGALNFNAAGKLTSQSDPTGTSAALDNASLTIGGESVQFPIRFGGPAGGDITQYGGGFSIYNVTQDGYQKGDLASISFGENGVILVRYTNGVSVAKGVVALGNFRNVQGLEPVNGGYWRETFASGPVIPGTPQKNGMGLLRQNALEESNVDLTQELVNMIVAQRAYQANAQTIKTQDQVQQTLVNLR
jgi:flagellar hook protein FlgE